MQRLTARRRGQALASLITVAGLGIGTAAAVAAPAQSADPAGDDYFEKFVRPVLVERCLPCHRADKAKGGLRLDTRENVLKGGTAGPAVVPGKAAEARSSPRSATPTTCGCRRRRSSPTANGSRWNAGSRWGCHGRRG